jgi:hypothetical protein
VGVQRVRCDDAGVRLHALKVPREPTSSDEPPRGVGGPWRGGSGLASCHTKARQKTRPDSFTPSDKANREIHRTDPEAKGKHIHEIKPVKVRGSLTDHANKVALDRKTHSRFTAWWRRLVRDVTKVPAQIAWSEYLSAFNAEPPANEAALAEFERASGFKLPADYAAFVRFADGGERDCVGVTH